MVEQKVVFESGNELAAYEANQLSCHGVLSNHSFNPDPRALRPLKSRRRT